MLDYKAFARAFQRFHAETFAVQVEVDENFHVCVLQNVLKIKPMDGLCRPLNNLCCCRGNINNGQHRKET